MYFTQVPTWLTPGAQCPSTPGARENQNCFTGEAGPQEVGEGGLASPVNLGNFGDRAEPPQIPISSE